MSYYSFGQETSTPEEYLRKTGSDYPENEYMVEPEPEYEIDYQAALQPEAGQPTAKKAVPAVAVGPAPVGPPPAPVQAGLGGSGLLLVAVAAAAYWLMKR